MTVIVRDASVDEVALIRALRLEMLERFPEAFGSTLAKEQTYGPDRWAAWIASGRPSVGIVDGAVAGMAGFLWPLDGAPGLAKIVSVYVRPAYQGRGLAGQITDHIVARIGRETTANRAVLMVRKANIAAIAAYRRVGFTVEDLSRACEVSLQDDEILMGRPVRPDDLTVNDR